MSIVFPFFHIVSAQGYDYLIFSLLTSGNNQHFHMLTCEMHFEYANYKHQTLLCIINVRFSLCLSNILIYGSCIRNVLKLPKYDTLQMYKYFQITGFTIHTVLNEKF